MTDVKVFYTHENSGFCVEYFRTVPNKQLLCKVDGVWHTATDDGTWEEPCSPVDMDAYTITVISEKEAVELIRKHKELTS